MKDKNIARIRHLYFFFACLFLILVLRIAYLQIFKREFLQNLAKGQHYKLIRINGQRGKILDRNGKTMATNLYYYSVFADPSLIDDPEKTARLLSRPLGMSKDEIKKRLTRKGKFAWLKRKISWHDRQKIKSLKLKGIGFIREESRFYPEGDLASHILGITDIDGNGLAGVELFYDRFLKGKEGWVRVLQDSASRKVIITPEVISPQEGASIDLTIDAQLQYWTEKCLEDTIKDFRAKRGSVVVMDASNGEILSLANYPSGDLNIRTPESLKKLRNIAVADYYEPGSVFKVVTLLASIEKNSFDDEDTIFCENGEWKIPGTRLHDWKPYGDLSFKEVFMRSSNIGVAKIANDLGKETLYDYMRKFGFGAKTGIDLPAETGGSIKHFSKWSKTSEYIMPIGQEVGVNLIQLARVFAIVANDGYLVKPHIVKGIYREGFYKDTRYKNKRILSADSAQRARNILINVVEEGTGKRARISGVTIGGKTGTAQKYDPEIGKYSPTKYYAGFVGFITGVKPPLVIAVVVDEPRKHHFGGVVAAPLFRKIAKRAIVYLEKESSVDVASGAGALDTGDR